MEVRVDGKTILVTGSTQGIGRAVALECARSGARAVIVSGLDKEDGEKVVSQIEAIGSKAVCIVQDLSAAGAADKLFVKAVEAFGAVDALVNSAGLTNRASTIDATPDDWQFLFRVNAEAPFFLIQKFLNHRRELKKPGEVVNILSMNTHGGTRDLTVYSATKSALATITKNAAHHHRFDRIRLNGINAGWVDTPAERVMQSETLGLGDGWLKEAEGKQPFGRLLKPRDITNLSVFLLSDISSPMTGAIIDQEQWVAGGVDG